MALVSRRQFIQLTAAGVIGSGVAGRAAAQSDVCSNTALLDALKVLHRACTPISCNFTELRVLDDARYRDALLAAFANRDLNAVHVFFPYNESELRPSVGHKGAFDWDAGKQSQLNTFKYINQLPSATIYIIGRASATGSAASIAHNRKLSQARFASVHYYLKHDLGIVCREFRGAYMGKEVLQLSISDATDYLKISPQAYRNDALILNQAVHVFAVPCVDAEL
jgi:hypothetical protein